MIRIFYVIWNLFIIWFWHAIWLIKSGRQFVYKILENRNYIIRLIWYDKLILCVRFVWQINLMELNFYMFRTQRRIKNPAKHLKWRYLWIYLTAESRWLLLQKS